MVNSQLVVIFLNVDMLKQNQKKKKKLLTVLIVKEK